MTTQEVLVQIYERAEKRLYAILRKKGIYASAAVYERSLLRQVEEELRRLRRESADAVNALVQENYEIGLKELTDILSSAGDDRTYNMFSRLNKRQVEIIARNTSGDFNKAIGMIGRRKNQYRSDNTKNAAKSGKQTS